jgi:hypothetical protein
MSDALRFVVAFSFGTTLIDSGHATAGVVINVFMAVLIGSFSLALLAPEMQGQARENQPHSYLLTGPDSD